VFDSNLVLCSTTHKMTRVEYFESSGGAYLHFFEYDCMSMTNSILVFGTSVLLPHVAPLVSGSNSSDLDVCFTSIYILLPLMMMIKHMNVI